MNSKQTIVFFLFFAFALNITLCQGQVLPPYNLVVSSVNATSVRLGWVPPGAGIGYEIKTFNHKGKQIGKNLTINPLSIKSTVISNLKGFSRYTIKIRTYSDSSFSREISIQALTLPKPKDISAVQTKEKGEVTFKINSNKEKVLKYGFWLELIKNNKLVLQVKSYQSKIIVSGLSDETYTPLVRYFLQNYTGETLTGKDVTLIHVPEADVNAPSDLKTYVRGNSIMLSWTQATLGVGYQVTVDSDPVPYYVHKLTTVQFQLHYLEPCTIYLFKVRTTSEGSKLSKEITKRLKTGGPLVTLNGVEETRPVSGTVTAYWNPIEPIRNCEFTYDIRLTNYRREIYQYYASGSESSYALYNVAEDEYHLSLATSVKNISGRPDVISLKKAFWTTGKGKVPPPYNLVVSSITATSVTLGWVPADWGMGYVITTVEQHGKQVGKNLTITPLSKTDALIPGLEVLQIYNFTIRTFNDASFSHGVTIQVSTVPKPKDISAFQTKGKSVVTFNITSDVIEGKPYEFLLELIKNNESVLQAKYYKSIIVVSGLSNGTYTPRVTATRDNYKGEALNGAEFTLTDVTAEGDVQEPSDLEVNLRGTYAILKWKAAPSGTGYLVTVGSNSVPYYLNGLESVNFDPDYLEPCTIYLFEVRTTSEGSKVSKEITKRLKTAGPLVTLNSAEETDPASGKVTLYWNPIKQTKFCKWIYYIELWNEKGKYYRAYASGYGLSYALYNVEEDEYHLSLATSVNNVLGQASYLSLKKAFWITGKEPLNPTNLKVIHRSATTISILWTPVSDVAGYQYTLDHKDPKVIIDGGSICGTKILYLTPSTKYTITVSSLTENSVSKGVDITAVTLK